MFDVKIINNEAILFEDGIELNLEPLRGKYDQIHYTFNDGSFVEIWSDNIITWFDSDHKRNRDDDMPAYIQTNGYLSYYKHDNLHRECGPAIIDRKGYVEYWLDNIEYTKKEFINKLNSSYGFIYHV